MFNTTTRRRSLAALAVPLLLLAACRGAEKPAADSTSAAAGTPLRVALLTSGSIADQGWNGMAYKGLLAVRDSLGAAISNIETKTPAEFDENFRQYGAEQYTLVFANGFEFQDAAARVAPQFPKTVYVVTSGRTVAPNLAGVAFAFEQAAYQAGVLAGSMTHSNTIGLIAGVEIPAVRNSFAAFARGATSINPNARVLTSYIGNWDDVSAGKELALSQIAQGADIIFQNADAAGLGVFQAVKEKHVLALGANANQNGLAPDAVIASVVIDLPKAMLMIAREVAGGTFKGRVIAFDMKADIVRLEVNPAFAQRIPANITHTIDSIGTAIRAGTFHTLDEVLTGSDSSVTRKR